MINCGRCEAPFEPTATRWLCPHCGYKENCCEGAPLSTADDTPEVPLV